MKVARAVVSLAATAGVAACSGTAPIGGTTALLPPIQPIVVASSSPAFKAVTVGGITGGSPATRLWVSNVSNENFRAALQSALAHGAMAADGAGRYRLDAELIELDQPRVAPDFTVTARVHYRLVALDDSKSAVFDGLVETPYAPKSGDTPSSDRLRVATEAALRENIAVVIHQLVEALQGPGQPAWAPPARSAARLSP